MANKPEINYLARDFESIKSTLVQYAKRFYPNEYNDFTEASFGSFLLDAVAYIGDVASFQLDYQANENMIDSAINRDNIIRLARQLGYKEPLSPNVTGFVTIYLNIPGTSTNTGPQTDYLPILKAGTSFSSIDGAVFVLVEDVDFSESDTEYIVSELNTVTGIPSKYAAKRDAPVVSGLIKTEDFDVPDQSSTDSFYKLELQDENIIEVITVRDLEGNIYYQVDALSQDVVYKSLINDNSTASNTLKVMKPTVAARRFILDFKDDTVSLIFGNGKEDSTSVLDSVNDPTKVVLQKYGKDYVSSAVLDPTVLNDNDKFGIGPSNTRLTITYRYNTTNFLSAGAGTLTQVSSPVFSFSSDATDETLKEQVITSIEVENEKRISGTKLTLSDDELKQVVAGVYSSQNRIITLQDYQSFSYRLPAEFGTIKRSVALRDDMSPRRSVNFYVLSEDSIGDLTVASQAVKDNLKTWISRYKTVSDSVDILDGKIVNFGVRFSFVSNENFNLLDARTAAEDRMRDYFNRRKYNFGESINVSELTKQINDTEQVNDVLKMEFYSVTGGAYSDIEYDFIKNTTSDGRFITMSENYLFEIKLFSTNITGEAI
tara:strand:+ start:13413 stop:15215 length:1803 start_codon:yes stop_codon:yes gene_type:complete